MADYGIKISKEGVDVKTATDEQLAFSSKYLVSKVVQNGTFSINVISPDTDYTTTIYHNLGYRPICIAFADTTPGGGKRSMLNTHSTKAMWTMKIYNDSVIFRFQMTSSGTPGVYNGYYYLFVESID